MTYLAKLAVNLQLNGLNEGKTLGKIKRSMMKIPAKDPKNTDALSDSQLT